ncbi:alpha-L-rhamnosidase N-terminal domain-containing protein [Nonomuraea bangladeshensis]|uniref:alpha-L-rhamnosidase N-terminal domain-containing protein n=1 Tax=Nonomuraea bangladeshensis TaxID=404385 RepID=UPI003C2CC962
MQTYDVGAQLRAGSNVIGAVLSDGWYRGRTGYERIPDGYGTRTAFLAELHADDTVIGTGPDWRSTTGEIVAADVMDGQESPRWARCRSGPATASHRHAGGPFSDMMSSPQQRRCVIVLFLLHRGQRASSPCRGHDRVLPRDGQ